MNLHHDPRAPEYQEADRRAGPPVRARQGVTGHGVRHVLVFGIAAAIICFWIVYFVYI